MLVTDLGKILRDLFPWQPSRCCDNQKNRKLKGAMYSCSKYKKSVGDLLEENSIMGRKKSLKGSIME